MDSVHITSAKKPRQYKLSGLSHYCILYQSIAATLRPCSKVVAHRGRIGQTHEHAPAHNSVERAKACRQRRGEVDAKIAAGGPNDGREHGGEIAVF